MSAISRRGFFQSNYIFETRATLVSTPQPAARSTGGSRAHSERGMSSADAICEETTNAENGDYTSNHTTFRLRKIIGEIVFGEQVIDQRINAIPFISQELKQVIGGLKEA